MDSTALSDTAKMLVADDKGLLAIDESTPTCNKRFAETGISETLENRRAYREWIIKTMAGHPGEKVTEGLDGLRERLRDYRGMGARFAKWRAVIAMGEGIPDRACIEANAHALARYAALCQEAGLVPVVDHHQITQKNIICNELYII
jgi:fructose-bisphosphate aldolase class I